MHHYKKWLYEIIKNDKGENNAWDILFLFSMRYEVDMAKGQKVLHKLLSDGDIEMDENFHPIIKGQ